MNGVELDLYKEDFNIVSNHSCLGRIIRTIIIVILVFVFPIFSPISNGGLTFLTVIVIFGIMFIADKYVRRLYSDWPKKKKFIGKLVFESDKIIISKDAHQELLMNDCSELVLFYDYYTGFTANIRDLQKNGNGLMYFKNKTDEVFIYKFNIRTEKSFNSFIKMTKVYKKSLPYFKEYIPDDVGHILKPDLSARIIYN